jgi:hypothetical protein
MTRRRRPLAVTVVLMTYAPFVAVLSLVGYAFGWRFLLLGVSVPSVLWLRSRPKGSAPIAVGRARTGGGLIVFSLLGSIFAGVLFGGLGVIFGFVVGFALRLSEVPIARSRPG